MDFDDWDRLYAEHVSPQDAAKQMKCSVKKAAQCLEQAQWRRQQVVKADVQQEAKRWHFVTPDPKCDVWEALRVYGDRKSLMRKVTHQKRTRGFSLPQMSA